MSWFSNLAEAYDRISDIVGIPDEDGNALLPRNHMTAKTDISVTIDGDGKFRRADENNLNIIVPCTEDSSTRTNKPESHPLHDQLGYLALDKKKRSMYLAQIAEWSGCHPKVSAVHKYVTNGTLLDDLQISGIKADSDKLFVRFSVEIPDDFTSNLWEDMTVAKAWQEYCVTSQPKNETLCYVTGAISPMTVKHPKGINQSVNGAKLISCNDETNYTYKGRFNKSTQANAISADASHRGHAMLKYLIATQGYKCDTQAVVAWAIDDGKALPNPFKDSYGLYTDTVKTEKDNLIEAQGELATDYAKKLRIALRGKGDGASLGNQTRSVAVMAVDAATTGRMGITFYQHLRENEYIDRIIAWHDSCRWWFRHDGRDYISAPGVDRIIATVYGERKGEGYTKIQKQARERLLRNIVCGEPIDRCWIAAAVTRVSNPFSYDKQDGGWDAGKWKNALNITCAITRKHYNEKKEEFHLELETTRTDRDYLFGRLLAIADRLESHARYLQTNKNDTDKRPTNAVRYMSAFASKPLRTWKLIFDQLNPYIQRLDGAEWYQRQIDEIMSLFTKDDFNDSPLGGKYLLGYSLQRRAFFNQNNNNDKEETSNESD